MNSCIAALVRGAICLVCQPPTKAEVFTLAPGGPLSRKVYFVIFKRS